MKNCVYVGQLHETELLRLRGRFKGELVQALSVTQGVAAAAQRGCPLVIKGGDITSIVQSAHDACREGHKLQKVYIMLAASYLTVKLGEIEHIPVREEKQGRSAFNEEGMGRRFRLPIFVFADKIKKLL